MEDQGYQDQSAAHTLDRIRAGSQQLLIQARERLVEIEGLLERGEFDKAHDLSEQVTSKLLSLAQAERGLALLADTLTVHGADLTEGTRIVGWGTVESITRHPCPHPGTFHTDIMLVHLDGEQEPRKVAATAELIILPDEE